MSRLNRIVLVRHGETEGESSVRYHGSTDVPLSELGREQMRAARLALPGDRFELVVASPLSRAWTSARLLAPGCDIRIERDLREIDFGAWEGLTASEIEARDPIRYADWRERRPGFEYPGGERREGFRARIARVVDGWLAGNASSLLAVAHKGVIRTIVEQVAGAPLADERPPLGGIVQLSRDAGGRWRLGRRPSSPQGVVLDD